MPFVAGQWVNLFLPGQDKRAYSIASAPGDGKRLELAVTRVEEGAVSPRLHELPVGSEVELDGPHGFFTRDSEARQRPALFVGTGTGLCPLRSMLAEELAAPGHPPHALLFGCRTAQDILWQSELDAWRDQAQPPLQLHVTLSRPGDGWQGRTGYVQRHVVELARSLGEPDVYICGLTRMVKEVRSLLKNELGYDRKRIFSERFD